MRIGSAILVLLLMLCILLLIRVVPVLLDTFILVVFSTGIAFQCCELYIVLRKKRS